MSIESSKCIELCGCGKPAMYARPNTDGTISHSCNEYRRCATYEELVEKLAKANKLLDEAHKIINYSVDDYKRDWKENFNRYIRGE